MTNPVSEDLISIGWIILGDDGVPVRPHRSGYSWQANLTHPPRVYTTEKKAKAYGTNVVEVFIKKGDANV